MDRNWSIAALIVMFFSTKFLWQITPFLYVLGLGLMVLPLFFLQVRDLVASTGAQAGLRLEIQRCFQPSEFAKI